MPLVNMSDQVIVVNRLAPIVDKIRYPYSLESFIDFATERGLKFLPTFLLYILPMVDTYVSI